MSENKPEIRYGLLVSSFKGLLVLGLVIALFNKIAWVDRINLYLLLAFWMIMTILNMTRQENSKQRIHEVIIGVVVLVIVIILFQIGVALNYPKMTSMQFMCGAITLLFGLMKWFQIRRNQKNTGAID